MKKLAAILFLTSALTSFGQTIGVNRTTGETLDAELKYNMATARFNLASQTASGSSTNLAIDARYREHFITAGTSFRFYLTNAVGSAEKVESVYLTVTNSSASTIYATNLVDTLEAVGNWGPLPPGKSTLSLTFVNGLWEVRQDTAKTPADMIGDGSVSDTEFGYLDGVTGPLQPQFAAKQDALTEGEGISIENGVISATISSSGESAFDATTNNVPIPLYTNTLATGTSGGYSAIVLGGGPTNIYSFDVRGLVSNPDGTAVLIASELISSHPEGGTNITAYWDASGTDAVLYVRGYEAENLNWRAVNISALVVTNGTAAAAAAPAFEEQVGNFASSSASATTAVTLTSAVAAGNQIILLVSGTTNAISATDMAGNTYSLVADETVGGVRPMQIFYAQATTGLESGDTITVTWSSSESTVKHITAIEASGITEFDIDGNDSGNETDSTVSVTTTAANTLIVGHSVWANSGVSFTATSPSAQIGSTKTFGFMSAEFYKESSSLGVNSAGGTLSLTHSNYRQVAAFK